MAQFNNLRKGIDSMKNIGAGRSLQDELYDDLADLEYHQANIKDSGGSLLVENLDSDAENFLTERGYKVKRHTDPNKLFVYSKTKPQKPNAVDFVNNYEKAKAINGGRGYTDKEIATGKVRDKSRSQLGLNMIRKGR